MKKEILFIHSAGPQGYQEGSDFLVSYLRNSLGSGYEVSSPMMPNPENPHFNSWKVKLEKVLASIENDNVVLIGHSLGGSILLKVLSESTVKKNIPGLFLIAAPYWGSPNWEVNEFQLGRNFPVKLPHISKVFLYHSHDDEVVPLVHMNYYAEKLHHAKIRAVSQTGHLFSKGLPELVIDIKNLQSEIEVFKTDVNDAVWARMLKDKIAKVFAEYEVHFDLEDCDKVMRVKSTTHPIQRIMLINLLKDFGFQAEVMKD
jgi:predicted alpha/beta hydrolase family esterase